MPSSARSSCCCSAKLRCSGLRFGLHLFRRRWRRGRLEAIAYRYRQHHVQLLFSSRLWLRPADPGQKPLKVPARAAYADFFAMFDVPFKFGAPWAAADDESRAAMVVITREMNDKL